MKLELDDDNLLRLNAAAFAAHGAWALTDPKSYHDNFYGTVDAKSDVKERWFGLAILGLAANNVAVAEGNGLGARDVRKNTLLATGAVFGAAALMEGYNISAGKQRNHPLVVGNAVAMAGLAALNIWKGAGGKDKKAKATIT